MRQLRLVGLAEDGGSLLLESPTGESYRLLLDERVRAACRGDLTRLGQIEIETDNPLRPREIQMRVRAGESAEEVAASSGMPLDRVLRFAYAVLHERSRVVAQARSMSVRPAAVEQLGGLVEERLVSRGTDAATLQWDAWRRDDGRWAVRLSWRHGDRVHAAHWSLDLGRRALQPEDPAAEQLTAKEFHARTITAVTPLAVAARAATETRGMRPDGVSSAPADRPRPARTGTDRAPADPMPADRARSAPDRTGADHAPADRARSERTAPDRARSDHTAPERPGRMGPGGGTDRTPPERAPSERAGTDRTPPEPAPSERAGTDHTPPERASSGRAGNERASSDRAGNERASSDRTGNERASSDRTGNERASSDRAGNERAADKGAGSGRAERRNGEGRGSGARRARETAPDEDPDEDRQPAQEGRIAAGGGTIPLLDAPDEDDRARRATVPSWDDILLGVRRRH